MSAYLSAVTDPKTMLALVGAAYVTLNVARFLGFMYGRTSTKVNLKKYKKLPKSRRSGTLPQERPKENQRKKR